MQQILKKLIVVIIIITSLESSIYAQAYMDTIFNNLIRTENGGWVAGDATYSIDLPDGRILWLFGDSFIGTVEADSSLTPGAKMIRNCAIIQDGDSMTALFQGSFEAPVDFVQTNTPDSTWFWPEHGIVENNTLKVIFSEFGTTEGTPGWNFEYRSAYMVLFTYPEIGLIGQTLLPYYELNGVMYGDRIMNDGDHTYIYGRKEENPDNHIPHAHLARSAIGDIMGEWEFYDGNHWLTAAESSGKITDHPVSQQYGVFAHLDKYVMITQEIWLGTKVYSLVANQPEGPWSNATVLFNTPYPFPDMLTYNAYPHPQFNENNELLISYNSNGSFWEIFNNVELYRPNFYRVPYTMIHSSFTPASVSDQLEAAVSLKNCYPNPAREQISIEFEVKELTNIKVCIYNMMGKRVYATKEQKMSQGKHRIVCDVSNLPAATYFITIADQRALFIHN